MLSLTSQRTGEWFKEEIRVLRGLDHIMDIGKYQKNVFVINFVENYDIIYSVIGLRGGRRGVFRATKRKTKFQN